MGGAGGAPEDEAMTALTAGEGALVVEAVKCDTDGLMKWCVFARALSVLALSALPPRLFLVSRRRCACP